MMLEVRTVTLLMSKESEDSLKIFKRLHTLERTGETVYFKEIGEYCVVKSFTSSHKFAEKIYKFEVQVIIMNKDIVGTSFNTIDELLPTKRLPKGSGREIMNPLVIL